MELYFSTKPHTESQSLNQEAWLSGLHSNPGWKKSSPQMAFAGDYRLVILPCPRRLSLPWCSCGQLSE